MILRNCHKLDIRYVGNILRINYIVCEEYECFIHSNRQENFYHFELLLSLELTYNTEDGFVSLCLAKSQSHHKIFFVLIGARRIWFIIHKDGNYCPVKFKKRIHIRNVSRFTRLKYPREKEIYIRYKG